MRLHIFQHEATCGIGSIGDWCASREVEPVIAHFYRGEALPSFGEVDALLVLGGSMNAYQDADFPHLKPVRAFVRDAIGAHKKVLGLCLGAQMVADALGSRVVRAAQIERGWIEIERRQEADSSRLFSWLPKREQFISWHGDTFAVPDGAVHGAQSEACFAQAFALGDHVLALQFHPEADASIVEGWIEDEPEAERAALREEFLSFNSRFERQRELLFAALDCWIGNADNLPAQGA